MRSGARDLFLLAPKYAEKKRIFYFDFVGCLAVNGVCHTIPSFSENHIFPSHIKTKFLPKRHHYFLQKYPFTLLYRFFIKKSQISSRKSNFRPFIQNKSRRFVHDFSLKTPKTGGFPSRQIILSLHGTASRLSRKSAQNFPL